MNRAGNCGGSLSFTWPYKVAIPTAVDVLAFLKPPSRDAPELLWRAVFARDPAHLNAIWASQLASGSYKLARLSLHH
jgi:hypothetical protein